MHNKIKINIKTLSKSKINSSSFKFPKIMDIILYNFQVLKVTDSRPLKVKNRLLANFIIKKNMDTKLILDNYLGKKTRTTEKDMGDGTKHVCDLDTNECYTVRM